MAHAGREGGCAHRPDAPRRATTSSGRPSECGACEIRLFCPGHLQHLESTKVPKQLTQAVAGRCCRPSSQATKATPVIRWLAPAEQARPMQCPLTGSRRLTAHSESRPAQGTMGCSRSPTQAKSPLRSQSQGPEHSYSLLATSVKASRLPTSRSLDSAPALEGSAARRKHTPPRRTSPAHIPLSQGCVKPLTPTLPSISVLHAAPEMLVPQLPNLSSLTGLPRSCQSRPTNTPRPLSPHKGAPAVTASQPLSARSRRLCAVSGKRKYCLLQTSCY